MKIDETIYLSRPQDVGIDCKDEEYGEYSLMNKFRAMAAGARSIDILSAYYNRDFLINLCEEVKGKANRRQCSIRMVFNALCGEAFTTQIEELRCVSGELKSKGFKNISIRLFNKAPLFHTKLYRFLIGTSPHWFVGSANASQSIQQGTCHEMMVHLTGKNEELSWYLDEVVNGSLSIDCEEPKKINSIPDFFRSGSLVFRPQYRPLFTFDALSLKKPDKEILLKKLTDKTTIPHAHIKTRGLSFDLLSAIGIKKKPEDEKVKQTRLKTYTIETSLGLWVPDAYRINVEKEVANTEDSNGYKLKEIKKRLKGISDEKLNKAFSAHVGAVKELLQKHHICHEITDDHSKFDKFIDTRRCWLNDPDFIKRSARVYVFTGMPEIWIDEKSTRAFIDSFFEDVSYRLSKVGRRSKVIKAFEEIVYELDDKSPFYIEEHVTKLVEEQGWNDECWDV